MFNYEEVDKYVTVGDLLLICEWAKEKQLDRHMISRIDRTKGERIYDIHFTVAQNGFNRKIRIDENNKIEVLEPENQYFWMS